MHKSISAFGRYVGPVLALLVPYLAFLYLASMFSEWLIDDAGITFAYARSLAGGHGLVSQPGMTPVEGYSNFLWLLIMVPFYLTGAFELPITPKIIAFVLAAITFWVISRLVLRLTNRSHLAVFVVLMSLAGCAPYVVWTCSGLENPLLVLLVITLLYQQLRYLESNCSSAQGPILAAAIIFGIALTRPDGIMYVCLFPVTVLLGRLAPTHPSGSRLLQHLLIYGGLLFVLVGSFVLFRYLYFGDIFPNTYYVKTGPTLSMLLPALFLTGRYFGKFRDLAVGTFGSTFWWLVPLISLGMLISFFRIGPNWRRHALLLCALFISGYTYLILANDWMGEYRFASAFFPLLLCTMVVSARTLGRAFIPRPGLRWGAAIVSVAAVLTISATVHYPRIEHYARIKNVNFFRISRVYGHVYNRWADYLELQDPSFLVPDIGGTLYHSKMRVYDLAGLCDTTIAKTRGKDQQRFYDYVFEEIRPTFIHTHGYFTAVSKLDDDPRFTRDYVAIRDFPDEYVKKRYKADRRSGDFIRRDKVVGREVKLDSLRNGLAP